MERGAINLQIKIKNKINFYLPIIIDEQITKEKE